MIIALGDTCTFGGSVLGRTDGFGNELYLLGVDGRGAPQSTVQAIQKAAGDGGFATPAYLKARVITVQGAIVGSTRSDVDAAFDRIQSAASIQPQPVTLTVAGRARTLIAQRQGEIVVSDESDQYLEFSITFLAVDPRWSGEPLTGSTHLPSSSGGLTVPFTVPFTVNGVVVSGEVNLTNPGSAPGKVVIRIDGPIAGPVISHSSGMVLAFAPSYMIPSGGFLLIDMDAHTALEGGTASRTAYITQRGWSSFDVGPNSWQFAASGSYPSAVFTVTATPGWQ